MCGYDSQGSPPVSQPTRQWPETSWATRSRNGSSASVRALDRELGDPFALPRDGDGRARRGVRLAGFRAEHEPAALDEEDPRPGIARLLVEGGDDGPKDIVGVAAAVDDRLDRLECGRLRHVSTSAPSNAAITSR